MGCCIRDLKDKEVVNVCDGRRLGYITDVEIDVCDGRLVAIVVPGDCRGGIFSKGEDVTIPWRDIKKIGDDIILVDVGERFCVCAEEKPDRKKRKFFG